MTPSTHRDGTLRAPRVRQRVLVPRGHPDPERVRRQLHDALSAHLSGALDAAFGRAGAPGDDAVWRIRRITFDLSVNAAWDAPHLARVWATQLAHAVRRTMATGGDGITVMRWANRPAYLAAFIRDAADGTAWSRWWFEAFVGLRILPRSAQMRSALVRDASLGAAALALMSAADVELAVGQLSTADARVVLDAIAPATAEGDVAESATILLAAHRALGAPPPRGDEERWSLRLVAEALRNAPRRSSGAIAEVARAIARLAIVAGEHAARFAIVRRLLAEGNASGLRLVLDAADAERIAPLARVGRTLVETIVEQVVDTMTPRVVGERARTAEVDWMPFGAPLLLAPLAAALPLDEATRDWPSVGGEDEPAARCASASALVRLFAMATACGGERAARVLADPTTRWLAGVGSAVSVAQLRDWLAQIGVARAERLDVTVRDWRTNAAKLTNSHWSQTAADTNTPGAAERRSAERNWLELPTSLGVPRPLELAVAIIADGMLRDLAWRLPGFASASLPHLWKNFFAVEAHIVHEPQRLVAQLSRPPLAMVIAMTGLLHQSYRLPWCDGKQIALFMGDG